MPETLTIAITDADGNTIDSMTVEVAADVSVEVASGN